MPQQQDGVIIGELKYAVKSKLGYPKGVVIWGMEGSGISKEPSVGLGVVIWGMEGSGISKGPSVGLGVDMIGIEC